LRGCVVNVVHVIIGLEVGGAELMLRRLLLTQRSQGEPPATVVSLTRLGPVGQRLRDDGFEVIALGMRTPLGAPRAWWRLRALLRQLKPDLVQTWMVHADLIGGLAARAANVRAVVWGVRTTDFSVNPRATRAVRWLCARLSATVPHTIVCAAEASRRAHVQAGYDASRMTVIPNGFDLDAGRPDAAAGAALRAELGLPLDKPVVGCVGRFHAAKDYANFVAAAGHVAERQPGCRFLMVGRGIEPANPTLRAWIDASGHASAFVLAGERRDVVACMSAMDVFVLASRSEGFPNVVGEAMAAARPCVVTDVGDAAALLGDTGRLVPAREPQALASAVCELLELPADRRRALGEAARARVTEEFSLHRAAECFTALQHTIVDGLRRGRHSATAA
jgi:glycosyltransferase involved in cell wall biosynthesis